MVTKHHAIPWPHHLREEPLGGNEDMLPGGDVERHLSGGKGAGACVGGGMLSVSGAGGAKAVCSGHSGEERS